MIQKFILVGMLAMTVACGPAEEASKAAASVVKVESPPQSTAAPEPPSEPVQRKLAIQGMSCKGCAATVRTALMSVEGVTDAKVAFDTGEAVITCNESVTAAALVEKVENYELGGVKQSYTAKEILQ